MNKLTLGEICNICKGRFIGNQELLSKEVDSIENTVSFIKEDSIYLDRINDPEVSVKNVKTAIKKGAISYITGKKDSSLLPFILVEDFKKANIILSSTFKQRTNVPTISITGSVGKTSTKDMCNSVLSQKYKILKTRYEENHSWMFTRPMYELMSNCDNYDIAVIETALDGAMKNNGLILKPDIVIMTVIGTAHIDVHKSQKQIFIKKSELLNYMSPIGIAYVNGSDKFLKTIKLNKPKKVKYFGTSEDIEYHSENTKSLGLKGTNCDLVYKKDRINVTIPVPGLFFIDAALPAFALGLDFGLKLDEIKNGIESFESDKHRMKVYETEYITIIDDSYNASLTSMKSSIDMFKSLEGRKVFITGDINNLGDLKEKTHEEIGEYIANAGINLLICAGSCSENTVKGVLKAGKNKCEVMSLPNKELINDIIKDKIKKGDLVLVKAGEPEKFHTVVEILLKL